MPRAFLPPRSRARRGWYLSAGLACVLAAGACTARREPLPLDPPADTPRSEVDEPAAVDEPAVSHIEEEILPGNAPTTADTSGPDSSPELPVEPPSLLDTINANTPPNVAAATRLVDAGRAHMATGDDGAALEQLERAIALDSGNPYAYYYLAELHFTHRTYDQAIVFADRAASLSDARAPAWASRAYTLQGNAFEAAGRFADARSAYTRAIQAAPGNLAAQVGLARVGVSAVPQP
jgi:TPR repeat/Tetratricopeptide repeat